MRGTPAGNTVCSKREEHRSFALSGPVLRISANAW